MESVSSKRDRTNDNTDLAVNNPFESTSTVNVSDNFVDPRYQPTIGDGLVPRTSQVLEKRWPSRSGPRMLEFLTGTLDASRIWIKAGGTFNKGTRKSLNYGGKIMNICIDTHPTRSA